MTPRRLGTRGPGVRYSAVPATLFPDPQELHAALDPARRRPGRRYRPAAATGDHPPVLRPLRGRRGRGGAHRRRHLSGDRTHGNARPAGARHPDRGRAVEPGVLPALPVEGRAPARHPRRRPAPAGGLPRTPHGEGHRRDRPRARVDRGDGRAGGRPGGGVADAAVHRQCRPTGRSNSPPRSRARSAWSWICSSHAIRDAAADRRDRRAPIRCATRGRCSTSRSCSTSVTCSQALVPAPPTSRISSASATVRCLRGGCPMTLGYDEINARLTAPGQFFEIEERDIGGVATRTWKNAPRSFRAVLAQGSATGGTARSSCSATNDSPTPSTRPGSPRFAQIAGRRSRRAARRPRRHRDAELPGVVDRVLRHHADRRGGGAAERVVDGRGAGVRGARLRRAVLIADGERLVRPGRTFIWPSGWAPGNRAWWPSSVPGSTTVGVTVRCPTNSGDRSGRDGDDHRRSATRTPRRRRSIPTTTPRSSTRRAPRARPKASSVRSGTSAAT